MTTPQHYAPSQKWLHWSTALVIFGMIPVGVIMVNLGDGSLKNNLYELHKSFGIIVFTLAVVRSGVRLAFGAPALPPGMPGWQKLAAGLSHAALYGLIVLVPVLGFVGTSMCCSPVNLFWTVPVPIVVPGGMEQAKQVLALHKIAVFTMAGILAVHIGAALYHGFIRRDGVLERMLPEA